MLRITVINSPSEERWVLQGRLIGPWAAELKSSWKNAHGGTNGKTYVVDVTDLTFIDRRGEKVLGKMMEQGAQFIVGGLYATHVIQNLRARCKARVCKPLLLLVAGVLCLAAWPRTAVSSDSSIAVLTTPRSETAANIGKRRW